MVVRSQGYKESLFRWHSDAFKTAFTFRVGTARDNGAWLVGQADLLTPARGRMPPTPLSLCADRCRLEPHRAGVRAPASAFKPPRGRFPFPSYMSGLQGGGTIR